MPSADTWLTWGLEQPEAVVSWLTDHHLCPPKRLRQWIRTYGLRRVAEVWSWALSAPAGTIRALTAWVEVALRDQWAAQNAWVLAWQARRAAARDTERTRAWLLAETARSIPPDETPDALSQTWTVLQSHLADADWSVLDHLVMDHLTREAGWSMSLVQRLASRGSPTYRRVAVHHWRAGWRPAGMIRQDAAAG